MLRTTRIASRVLLIGLDWPQNGYLAAGLHEAGIETFLLTPGRPEPFGLGHYCQQIRSPRYTSPDYEPFLREQIARIRPDLLIPLCEPLMELLWTLDIPGGASVYPPTEAWQRDVILDRRRLYARAAAARIPIAPWMRVNGPGDLEEAQRAYGFPLVLRGTAGFAGLQVRIVDSPNQAIAALEELRAVSPHPPFAQAFIRGGRYLFGGIFRGGEALRSYAHRMLDAHPAQTGPVTRVSLVHDERLSTYGRAVFRDLQWNGIAFAEFIRSEAGEFVLMEINARPWGSICVAEANNSSMCRAFGEMLAGGVVDAQKPYLAERECVSFEHFLLSRRRSGVWSTLWALPAADMWRCLQIVPWRRPRLAFHVLRRAYRGLAG